MATIPIYTIGYGAREMAALIAVLKARGIEYLLDVRSRPYSRYKPDFSKAALAQHLEAAGIRYVFMGDTLGGQPDDATCYEDGKVIYELVAEKAFYREGIDRLRRAWQQQLPVCLMCSEGKPEQCHRTKLIGKTLVAAGIAVAHIDENNEVISQEDADLRRSGGQPSLFPELERPASRKRYRKEERQ
jgi:uncharacterized protein (DUF488 family)